MNVKRLWKRSWYIYGWAGDKMTWILNVSFWFPFIAKCIKKIRLGLKKKGNFSYFMERSSLGPLLARTCDVSCKAWSLAAYVGSVNMLILVYRLRIPFTTYFPFPCNTIGISFSTVHIKSSNNNWNWITNLHEYLLKVHQRCNVSFRSNFPSYERLGLSVDMSIFNLFSNCIVSCNG